MFDKIKSFKENNKDALTYLAGGFCMAAVAGGCLLLLQNIGQITSIEYSETLAKTLDGALLAGGGALGGMACQKRIVETLGL